MNIFKKNKEIRIYTGIVREARFVKLEKGGYKITSSDAVESGERVHLVQFGKNSKYLMRLLYSAMPANIETSKKLAKKPDYDYTNSIMVLTKDAVTAAGQFFADDLKEIVSSDEYARIANSEDPDVRAMLSSVQETTEIDRIMARSHANRIYPDEIENIVNDDLYDAIRYGNFIDEATGNPMI